MKQYRSLPEMMTDYEHFLFEDWFKSENIRKDLIISRPSNVPWNGYTLRLFTESRMNVGENEFDEPVNWDLMAKMIEEDLTFLRLSV